MVSSISIPTISEYASMVTLFNVNPKALTKIKVEMILTGIVIAAITVVRKFPRKSRTIRIARIPPPTTWLNTCWKLSRV